MCLMSVCAAPTCSHQSFDGSSYYADVDVDEMSFIVKFCVKNKQTNNVCSSLLSRMGAILDYDFQLFKEYFQFLNRLYDITWCVTVYAK